MDVMDNDNNHVYVYVIISVIDVVIDSLTVRYKVDSTRSGNASVIALSLPVPFLLPTIRRLGVNILMSQTATSTRLTLQ
jgi:hypothetical protein